VPKKKLSDIVFIRVSPPDHKTELGKEDLSNILVRRLGLKRKEGRANHAKLLLEFMKYRKDNIPIEFEQISRVLGVSQSQTYEELRKWRTLGLVEFVRIPVGNDFIKGYMLTGNTVNRLLDKVESNTKSFLRKTRRIAKDFDDLLMLDMARLTKAEPRVAKSDKSQGGPEDDNPKEPESGPKGPTDFGKKSYVSDEDEDGEENDEEEDIDPEDDDDTDVNKNK